MLRLREIRKRRKLTMKQLGEMVGVTESAIGLYETGRRKPDYEMLLKLGEALDCSVPDIIGYEKSPPEEDELVEELQMLRDDPGRRALLHATRDMSPDQVRQMTEFLEGLKRQSGIDS